MKRTVTVGILGVLVVAALAAKPLKFPWAGADWNAEVTMTKLELEARNWNSDESWVVQQSGGKTVWTCEGVSVVAEAECLRVTATAKLHAKVAKTILPGQIRNFYDYFVGAWQNRAGVPRTWPLKVDVVMDGKIVYTGTQNIK